MLVKKHKVLAERDNNENQRRRTEEIESWWEVTGIIIRLDRSVTVWTKLWFVQPWKFTPFIFTQQEMQKKREGQIVNREFVIVIVISPHKRKREWNHERMGGTHQGVAAFLGLLNHVEDVPVRGRVHHQIRGGRQRLRVPETEFRVRGNDS